MMRVMRDCEYKKNLHIARDKPRRIDRSVMQEKEYALYYAENPHAHQRRHWAKLKEIDVHQKGNEHHDDNGE